MLWYKFRLRAKLGMVNGPVNVACEKGPLFTEYLTEGTPANDTSILPLPLTPQAALDTNDILMLHVPPIATDTGSDSTEGHSSTFTVTK